jgi:hypothetical protein
MTRRLTWLSAAALAATILVPLAPDTPTAQAAATTTTFCGDRTATEAPLDESLESYTPINPTRLVDTRKGTGGVNVALAADCTLRLDLNGSIVPLDATAVSLSVTGVAETRGYLTAYPCEAGRPDTSNLNVRVGIGTPNLVVGLLDTRRSLCIYSNAGSHIVVDLAGWWSPGPDRFNSIDPVRAYDTRELAQPLRLPAGHVRDVQIAGSFIPAEATAAVVTLTATDALTQGWISVFPCGEPPPLASNLNVRTNEARAVSAIVGLGTDALSDGKLCIQSNTTTHVIIDVNGYYAPAPQFGPTASLRPLAGSRIADSRKGIGGWSTPFKAEEVRSFDPVAGSSLAAGASAVMLNVIGTNAPGRGNLRVYPCGEDVTESSAVNFSSEGSATNLVPVALSDKGKVCIYASQPTDVVVDLFGVMTAPEGSFAEQLSFGSTDVWPEYSPDGQDYGVRCAAGSNSLKIHLDLLPFATAKIDGTATPPGDVTEVVVTDELLPITMSRGGETKQYFFRCLPADFPVLDIDRPGEPTPGWYLTTFGQGTSPSGTFTVILDNRGAPVWYKRTDKPLINFQRRADGTLVASSQGFRFGIPSDDVLHRIVDLGGNSSGTRGTDSKGTDGMPAFPVDHHDYVDITDDANGNSGGWAILSFVLRTGVDLTDLGDGYFVDDSVVDSTIREFDANGVKVWEWNAKDYFGENESTFPQRFGNYAGQPGVNYGGEVNIHHINSLMRIDDGTGDYLASGRHLDAVFRVDRSTDAVKWILGSLPSEPGNPPDPDYIVNKSNAPRLTILNDPFNGTRRQHDARLVGDVLTMFDNRTAMGQPSRAVAYKIDEVNLTATMLWQILEPSGRTSPAQGSVRRSADGSTLIGWGVMQPVFEEFDAAGNRLMAITQIDPATGGPDGFSYRIVKYPAADFDITELRSKAGGDAEAPPAAP